MCTVHIRINFSSRQHVILHTLIQQNLNKVWWKSNKMRLKFAKFPLPELSRTASGKNTWRSSSYVGGAHQKTATLPSRTICYHESLCHVFMHAALNAFISDAPLLRLCICHTTFSSTEVIFSFWQNNYLCSERTESEKVRKVLCRAESVLCIFLWAHSCMHIPYSQWMFLLPICMFCCCCCCCCCDAADGDDGHHWTIGQCVHSIGWFVRKLTDPPQTKRPRSRRPAYGKRYQWANGKNTAGTHRHYTQSKHALHIAHS